MRKFLPLFLIVCLCIALTSCASSPPDIESVDICFQKNYEDIQLIVDFMKNSAYDSIYIDSVDETMYADFKTVDIKDKEINNALTRLLKKPFVGSQQYYFVSKSGNTITLLQWKSAQDIGCGVAYSINGTALPEIEYCTELESLSKIGWYYYVDDYNAWRSGERPQVTEKTGDDLCPAGPALN